jgi:Mycotoxin biosynthesis protein UstYa
VYIHDWEKYDLPPGQNTTWGMIYSVALFHQMHCLGQLRRFSYMFLDAIEKGDQKKMDEIKHMFIEMDHAEHMLHCFDYLRQTISCAGDMAMEWPRTEPNGDRFAVDGWDIPHECKDWVSFRLDSGMRMIVDMVQSQITDYMDKNHFEHSMVAEIAPLIGSSGKRH